MTNRKRWMRRAARAALMAACVTGWLGINLASAAQTLGDPSEILDAMRANGRAIEDLDATITVQTYADGEPDLTQRIRLLLMQPDRMRQEYLAPDYFAGNLNLIVGDSMWTYIAASDTWYTSDLASLSAAEQPWLTFRQILRGAQDELDDYAFSLLEVNQGIYRLQGTPKRTDAAYGLIDLWVDGTSFVPTRRDLYDVDMNLLVEVHILEIEEVASGAFIARRLEAYDETGELRSTIHYDDVVVNHGLDPILFAPPALEEGTSDD